MKIVFCILLLIISFRLDSFQSTLSINVEKVNNSIFSYECTNVRVTAIDTQDGIILIDTHRSPSIMKAILDSVKTTFSKKTIRYVINTHGHWDHTGGNQLFDPSILVGHENIPEFMNQFPANTPNNILNIKNKLQDFSLTQRVEKRITDLAAWQSILNDLESSYKPVSPKILVKKGDKITVSGLTLEFYSCGYLHTNHDLFILVPELNILFVGDVMSSYSQWSFSNNTLTDLEGLSSLLKKIMKDNPNLEWIVPAHGKAFPPKDISKTIDLLQERIGKRNVQSSAVYNLVQRIKATSFKEALEDFQQTASTSTFTFSEEEFSQLAREYESRGLINESMSILQLALKLLSGPLLIYDDLGRNYLKLGNKEKAIEAYETMLKRFPQYKSAAQILSYLKQ